MGEASMRKWLRRAQRAHASGAIWVWYTTLRQVALALRSARRRYVRLGAEWRRVSGPRGAAWLAAWTDEATS